MQKIKEARRAKGWTQKKLAAVVGLYQPNVSEIEHGKRRPRVFELVRIARALDVSPGDLIEEGEHGK